MKWRHNRTPIWSRNKLLQRDSYACAYCTRPADTVDHILPVSQGGTSTWLNTVASCRPCNAKKRNRTPSEAHMPLNHQPFVPDWHHLYETAIPYNTAALAS
jgi:5-methylcytosine-specific restriction endonuclease McrA